MARTRGKIDNFNEAAQVIALYKNEKVVWKKERLLAIKLLIESDKSYDEIAGIIGRARSRIQVWTKVFRERGLDGLLSRSHGGGRKSSVTTTAQEAMIEKLKQGSFRTAKQFQVWLREEYQIQLSVKGVYYHLGKLGGRLKVPRPSHLKKDEAKAEEFRITLAEKMLALNLPKDKELKLWAYDEMRYGLHPLLRKMWSLVGHRVVAPVKRRFKWGYLFGAIEVSAGLGEFLFTDGLAKDFDYAFLKQISDNYPDHEHVIIGDGAGFHHKENQHNEQTLPENIHIITLPAYSPELNPIEKLWDIVKDKICTIHWEKIEDLENAIENVLKEWWSKKQGFNSLFRSSYIRTELNAI